MTKKLIGILLYCIILPAILPAQELLSLEETIRLSLEKNFNIYVARKNVDISQNNHTRGNAGSLPQVNFNAGYSGSIINSKIEFLDGRNQNVSGANNTRYNASIAATWTIFDGLVMFDRYNQLGINREIANLNLRLEMESVLQQIISTYYDIVQKEQTLKVFRQNLLVSQQRVDIAQDRYELGVFSKMDLLRAQVDRNNDSTLVINQRQTIFEAKTNLNSLLNRPAETSFMVEDTIQLRTTLEYETLKQKLDFQNTTLQLSRKNLSSSELDLRIAKGNTLPQVNLDLSYDFARSKSGAGFARTNRSIGPAYGIRFNYPIFDGNNRKREIANAQINKEVVEENIGANQNIIAAQYEIAYKDYLRNLELYQLERYNADVAQQNLDIAIDKFRLGGLSALDFRDIQQDALDASNRLIVVLYQIKLNEIELLRVSGELVKESGEN
ncbi:MAG: TolC family protein [Microscillaceae bacterium]|nr:TolC family protein [Microscillaceae bacterium]